jgi:hypothetical protein
VVVVAFIAKSGTPTVAPNASLTPARSPAAVVSTLSPAASPTAAPEAVLPTRNAAAEPLSTLPAFDRPAGEARLVPPGPAAAAITLTLPDGWSRAGTTMVLKRSGDAGGPVVSLSAWQVRQVDTFACRWSSQPRSIEASTDPTATQAHALSSWWGQDPRDPPTSNAPVAPLASTPRVTSFAGHSAWSLEVLVPLGLDLAQCDGGQLVLWEAANGDVRTGLPGELHHLWVVDVPGGPIVVDATSSPKASPTDRFELEVIIGSIYVEP